MGAPERPNASILKAQNDEAFIDDLLVQTDVLRKAYDRENT